MAEEHRVASHRLYLGVAGFHVEHGWQIALVEPRVLQEVLCLVLAAASDGEEVVGACAYSVASGLRVVVGEVGIADGGSFG